MNVKKYQDIVNSFDGIIESVKHVQELMVSYMESEHPTKRESKEKKPDTVTNSEIFVPLDDIEKLKSIIRLSWLKLNSHKHNTPQEAENMFSDIWKVFEDSEYSSDWIFL